MILDGVVQILGLIKHWFADLRYFDLQISCQLLCLNVDQVKETPISVHQNINYYMDMFHM